ncbi:MAG: heme exporter protein CcmB [Dehalococcoidia bacterium]|nr:heme exporter protein CcmB [Dehalococcoidia bacterium]
MTATWAILEKDLRLLWRQRTGWVSAGAFAAMTVITFSFAFDLATADVRPLLPGVLWVTFLFAGVIASSHSFSEEQEQGTFDALLLAPAPRSALYAGKALANLVGLLAIEAFVLVLGSVLFNVPLLVPRLLLVTVVGTVGYVGLATLLSTLGAVRSRAVLLPVLTLPLLVPLLIAAVRATGEALSGAPDGAPWLLLLAVFSFWSAVGAALLFPLVVEQ